MKELRKNASLLAVGVLVLLAIIGFGLRSEGRLSTFEAKAKAIDSEINTIEKDIAQINAEIRRINNRLTGVETDIGWLKRNATTQTNKIDRILERLESQSP